MVYGVLVIASFFAACISGTAGFGGSLLLLPVVTRCLGAQLAVPVLTLAQLMGNLARMAAGRKQIAWGAVGWFCLTALPLAALGAFGFSVLPKAAVSRVIGAGLVLLVVLKRKKIFVPAGNKKTLLLGGALTGALSGLVGSGGPIGAAVFLSLGLPPVAYLASEATTATAMHLLKTVVYSKMAHMTPQAFITGCAMGAAMVCGTFAANRVVRQMDKGRFERYTAALLCAVGGWMLVFGG